MIKNAKAMKNNRRGDYQSPAGITLVALVITVIGSNGKYEN